MIDLVTLRDALAAHGRVARIVVVQTAGSTPREVGAAMLVWQEAGGHLGHSGTIGGGALEWQAITKAATLLTNGKSVLTRHPLGPELGAMLRRLGHTCERGFHKRNTCGPDPQNRLRPLHQP